MRSTSKIFVDHVDRSSLKQSHKQAERTTIFGERRKKKKTIRRQKMPEKNDSLLIVVKGDPLSQAVQRDARSVGFSGKIVKLSMHEAGLQGTPLPLLIQDHKSWGPDSLVEYFKKPR